MKDDDRDRLIAAVTSAHRARDADGRPRAHPAWHDLDARGRLESFDATLRLRALEAAADPAGLSTTAHSVLARIRSLRA